MVHIRKNSRRIKWAVSLLEMGFAEAQIEKVLPTCATLEEAVQRLCGEEEEEEEAIHRDDAAARAYFGTVLVRGCKRAAARAEGRPAAEAPAQAPL
mmetsp:Transcript_90479/g.260827  ORF Transcript_90479/g.260827 Transcript_90479/m.260827 type:complete len:96 (-) Transcript_90479:19-306(-)